MRSMREHQAFDDDGEEQGKSGVNSIGNTLDDLEQSLEHLEKTVVVMGERLSPIMREQPPSPTHPNEELKQAESAFDDGSPIRRELRTYIRKVDRANQSLQKLLGGVDV